MIGAEIGLLLLLMLSCSLSDWYSGSTSGDAATDAGNVVVAQRQAVTIRGTVNGSMAPGGWVPLDLSLNNPNDFAVSIEDVKVTLLRINAPRSDATRACVAGDFQVRQLDERLALVLDGHRTEDLGGMGMPRESWPAVGMLNRPVNQDGCKGAVLTLGFEANGVEVHP